LPKNHKIGFGYPIHVPHEVHIFRTTLLPRVGMQSRHRSSCPICLWLSMIIKWLQVVGSASNNGPYHKIAMETIPTIFELVAGYWLPWSRSIVRSQRSCTLCLKPCISETTTLRATL
jgi:hypothetical protein